MLKGAAHRDAVLPQFMT